MFFLTSLILLAMPSTSVAFTPIQRQYSFGRDLVCAHACRSASVSRVADKTKNAMDKIQELETKIKGKSDEYEKEFNKRINQSLADAKVTDGRLGDVKNDIKVEYANEFSIDKITGVITSSIKAFGKASSKGGKLTAESVTSPEALSAYTDLVNQIGEAAKTESKSAASFSYSMSRLGPGLFVFLSATASNLQDSETFGDEAITATSFMFRLVESEDDIKQSTNFDLTLIQAATLKEAAESDKANVLLWKDLQLKLVEQVGNGTLSMHDYTVTSASYEQFADAAMERLNHEHFGASEVPTRTLMMSTQVTSLSKDRNTNVINMRLKEAVQDKDLKILKRIKILRTTCDVTKERPFDSMTATIEMRLSRNMYGKKLLAEL